MDPVYPLHFTHLRVTKRNDDGSCHFDLTIDHVTHSGESPVDDLPNRRFFMAAINFGKRTQPLTIIHNTETRSGIAL